MGKKNFSGDGGGEGGKVLKYQGCSKLLWGRGAIPEGELPDFSPPLRPCMYAYLAVSYKKFEQSGSSIVSNR